MPHAVQHRHRRAIGWLVAIAILLHGWLPILFQAALVEAPAETVREGHAHHAEGAPAHHAQNADHAQQAHHAHHADAPAQPESDRAPTGKAPECPVLHSAVCLCAVLVKVLPAPAATASLAATTRHARVRLPPQRPRRQTRLAPFEARAPPFSDRAQYPT
jgi:hypothetical protein